VVTLARFAVTVTTGAKLVPCRLVSMVKALVLRAVDSPPAPAWCTT
jgi:hypothetical protein